MFKVAPHVLREPQMLLAKIYQAAYAINAYLIGKYPLDQPLYRCVNVQMCDTC
jgi:hypothetical protein